MIWWSVEAFKAFDPDCRIILTLPRHFLDNWEAEFGEEEKALGYETVKVEGGYSRFLSVRNAILYLKEWHCNMEEGSNPGELKVFIHDGARPLVSPQLISRGALVAAKGVGAVPVIPLVDSIRMKVSEGTVAADRSRFVAVQTPQIFLFDDILEAYENAMDESCFTDDASVAENNGVKIETFQGDSKNIKITNPEDFKKI